jgi:predicted AlkP superfamily phosphohydrolase/phosphomutase
MNRSKAIVVGSMALCIACINSGAFGQESKPRPRVVVVGVNGMEWDIIRPLLLRGELPSLASVIERGVHGKLGTLSAPNCPKVYTALATSVAPEDNGITGFIVGGTTASTKMLRQEPLWSILSRNRVSVGMANVPATFPVMPVNGYMVSGMLTRGKGCEDGLLCSTKLSEVQGGDAVYPPSLVADLQANVGDFPIDCSRMPTREELSGREAQAIDDWLGQVSRIRAQQTRLFDFLLSHHPTDFTMLVQSCEDRVGHWLYPIQPHNLGYDPRLHAVRLQAFPDQYRAFDEVLGHILKHVDAETYLFIISDHGIKPLREFEGSRVFYHATHQHDANTPIVAHHDFADGDDVPGLFIAAGPNIKKDLRLMGLPISIFDIAPTILHMYGIDKPAQMKGRVMTEIFEEGPRTKYSANVSAPRR